MICNANTRHAKGLCLEVHDLILAKYAAGRPKDDLFIRAAIAATLVSRTVVEERLAMMPIPEEQRERIRQRILYDFRE